MPIEDVEYLIDNSEQESSLVFIDSSSRDRAHHPTPSEYVVPFDEPFKHVFGIDVLDATVPGTMYNVDVLNNALVFLTLDVAACSILSGSEEADRAAISQTLFALGYGKELLALLGSTATNSNTSARVLVIDGPTYDAFSDTAGTVIAFVRRVIRGVPLTLGPVGTGGSAFSFAGQGYALPAATLETPLGRELDAWIATHTFAMLPSASSTTVYAGTGVLYDLVYYTKEAVRADAFGSTLLDMTLYNVTLEPGNYTVTSLQSLCGVAMAGAGIHVISTSPTSSVEVQGKYRFASAAGKRFIFDVGHSTAGPLLGFDMYATLETNALPVAVRDFNAVVLGAEPRPLFMSVLDGGVQRLDTPGLVTLLGVRFITLRCPEIEENMGNVGKYGSFSTGIGVFKLSNPSELAQLRFDYVSLIRKPFHPIGKLFRLTLRFELNDGTLYDFKGINHQLLVTVKYYVPSKKEARFGGSLLNPDYDPDFMRYVVRQTREAAEAEHDEDGEPEDDDEEVVRLDDATKRRIILEQYKHDFLQDHELRDFVPRG